MTSSPSGIVEAGVELQVKRLNTTSQRGSTLAFDTKKSDRRPPARGIWFLTLRAAQVERAASYGFGKVRFQVEWKIKCTASDQSGRLA